MTPKYQVDQRRWTVSLTKPQAKTVNSYSAECVEGVFSEVQVRGFHEVRDAATILRMQENPGEDFYSVEEAARFLGRTPERIRQMLHAGELEGEQTGEDPHAPWKVYRVSVDTRRDRSRG